MQIPWVINRKEIRKPLKEEEFYIFCDAEAQFEWDRLRLVEVLFDPATRRFLSATGMTQGWRCLEVGAGAGSVAKWLAKKVGPSGAVMALDRNCRFLQKIRAKGLKIHEQDIRETEFPECSFDLIHARHVLIHIPKGILLLPKLWRWLKPGGWLVLEEPDFSHMKAFVASPDRCQAFERVVRTIHAIYASRESNGAFGFGLPQAVKKFGVEELIAEQDAPLVKGGSLLGRLMDLSAEHLASTYVETGLVSQGEVETYREFVRDPSALFTYYSVVRVGAKKPQQ